MKYIFLDFDGVLNSDYWFASSDYRRLTRGKSSEEVMLIYLQTHLSPRLIQKVNQLVKDSGAKVVASTTWRLRYSDEELSEFLRLQGATFKISDRTPRATPQRLSQPIIRGDEINAYIKALKELPEGIVILDDIANMDNLSHYLVHTDDRVGITLDDVKKALNIINTPFVLPPDKNKGNDYVERFDIEEVDD